MTDHKPADTKTNDAISSQARSQGSDGSGNSELPGGFRTKASDRKPTGPRATHAPERLKEFILPEVAIDGLTLGEALRKLMGVYEETCKKTGETPLRLSFDLPSGNAKKLHLRLGSRNFNSSIQLLATLSRMSVSREKLEYHFKPIADERKQVTRAIRVTPDFMSKLHAQAGITSRVGSSTVEAPASVPIETSIKLSGMELDPSTRVSLSASGVLNLETTSSVDAAMISALAGTLASEKPVQHKFTSQVVEIPAGTHWTPPEVSQMTGDQVQSLIGEMAQNNAINLTNLPSITTANGYVASIEMNQGISATTDGSGVSSDEHNTNKVMHITGNSLGFGQEATVDYTDTIGALDESGKKLVLNKRTDLADSGYSSDGGSRLVVQTRADGPKTLLIVTGQLIDATGRPVHDAN